MFERHEGLFEFILKSFFFPELYKSTLDNVMAIYKNFQFFQNIFCNGLKITSIERKFLFKTCMFFLSFLQFVLLSFDKKIMFSIKKGLIKGKSGIFLSSFNEKCDSFLCL